MKWVMPRPNVHAVFSLYNSTFSVLFFKCEYIFSFGPSFILQVLLLSRTNVDCIFLTSKVNKMFVLLEMLCQISSNLHHQKRFQKLIKIDRSFAKIGNNVLLQHTLMFDKVLNLSLIMIQKLFLTKIPRNICFS